MIGDKLGIQQDKATRFKARHQIDQGDLAGGLVDELLELIHKYDETMYMATVIGCLELVKQQLISESIEEQDE